MHFPLEIVEIIKEYLYGIHYNTLRCGTGKYAFRYKGYMNSKTRISITYIILTYENKILVGLDQYNDYKENGVFRGWFTNGQLQYEHYYINGRLYGISKEWDYNGQLTRERSYHNGYLHGISKEWDYNGQLTRSKLYEHGQIIK